jgi:NarL family two-component system response regulator LiaR
MESRHQPISVLLAEDHALVREGTRQMLERHDVITVVGEAVDGETAIEMTRDLRPDVLVLDMSMPVANGVEVTRVVRAVPDPPQVLILSAYDDSDYASAALRAGASGYLLKTASSEDLYAAILAVARGEVVLHPAIAAKVLEAHPEHAHDHVMTLSDRELEVLSHASRGLRTADIADVLSVSSRTVESHFTSIYNKLGVANRTAAVLHAASQGWIAADRDE